MKYRYIPTKAVVVIIIFGIGHLFQVSLEWNAIVMAPSASLQSAPRMCSQDPRKVEWKTSSQNDESVVDDIETECRLMDAEALDSCEIPKNIHIVWYSGSSFRFDHYLSLKSMFVTIRPDNFFVHGRYFPVNNTLFNRSVSEFGLVTVKSREVNKVHGRSVDVLEHKTDVIRIESLIRFGGMYFDTDVLLLRNPFELFRNKETVFGPEKDHGLQSGVIFSKRCSRFMRRWYKGYEEFNDELWAYDAIKMPFKLYKEDSTGVTVDGKHIKTDWPISGNMTFSNDTSPSFWSDAMVIHTYIRGHEEFKVGENETRLLSNNYGHIARNILAGKPGLATDFGMH
jgi:hypothetical protein